jgi:hypothetical protein
MFFGIFERMRRIKKKQCLHKLISSAYFEQKATIVAKMFGENILTIKTSVPGPQIGLPAVDPVLKRAQFNQKIVNLTQQQEESSRARMGMKRQVSAETRYLT